mmetsp:Transcript_39554/g.77287  ORF Transcript_39554/g.77287 Transcript_39554/m.77287 type:complete len:321 (-) Transcript_39554:2827-3789(-)
MRKFLQAMNVFYYLPVLVSVYHLGYGPASLTYPEVRLFPFLIETVGQNQGTLRCRCTPRAAAASEGALGCVVGALGHDPGDAARFARVFRVGVDRDCMSHVHPLGSVRHENEGILSVLDSDDLKVRQRIYKSTKVDSSHTGRTEGVTRHNHHRVHRRITGGTYRGERRTEGMAGAHNLTKGILRGQVIEQVEDLSLQFVRKICIPKDRTHGVRLTWVQHADSAGHFLQLGFPFDGFVLLLVVSAKTYDELPFVLTAEYGHLDAVLLVDTRIGGRNFAVERPVEGSACASLAGRLRDRGPLQRQSGGHFTPMEETLHHEVV